ncbi:TetR/AcrR family transcriptional regulator [Nocardia acidivorans]|uniref:TetR/AcrR family transcriptional regulator n=1 Tax=Nocardia acidivorans TaxID=404580 RepID=UPI0008374CD4|nr:TetR/AcrR family transcriptional regulator [Nocardia acidivorans]
MARPKTPRLNRAMIVDAALELVASAKGLTMPGLADALGVSVSSVYHHVRNRTELVELIRGRIAAREFAEVDQDGRWRTALAAWLHGYRSAFSPYPDLVRLLIGQTISAPEVLEQYEHIAQVIIEAGFPREEALPVIMVLDSFALGSALDLSAPDVIWATTAADHPHMTTAIAAAPAEVVARADAAFEYGLRCLLDGLALRLGETPSAAN